MKKYMPIVMAIIIGNIFGNLIFDSYESEVVMTSDGNVYMLQYGAYTKKEVLNENTKNLELDSYIIENINDVYYVYFGITTNYYNALNIVDFYKDKGIFLYIKENYLGKSELIEKIKNNDLLIKDEKNNDLIIKYIKDNLNIYKNSINN